MKNCIARTLIFFAFLIMLVLAAGLSYFGYLWLEVELQYEKATKRFFIYAGAVLMVLAILKAVVTVFAWVIAIGRITRLFNTLSFLCLLLVILYADYALFAFQLKNPSSPYVQNLEEDFTKILQNDDWQKYFDYFHEKLKCCGVNGSQDLNQQPFNCSDKIGCAEAYRNYIDYNFTVTGSIAAGIAFLNLCVSLCLNLRRRRLMHSVISQ